jgi:hypothetical protein
MGRVAWQIEHLMERYAIKSSHLFGQDLEGTSDTEERMTGRRRNAREGGRRKEEYLAKEAAEECLRYWKARSMKGEGTISKDGTRRYGREKKWKVS